MAISPAELPRIRAETGAALAGFTGRQRRDLAGISADLVPCVDAIEELLAGGKRLRAAFCYWGWRACGGDDGPRYSRPPRPWNSCTRARWCMTT